MFMPTVEYILKWRNISILGTYIFKRKPCPFIFRASQYICRQIITLPTAIDVFVEVMPESTPDPRVCAPGLYARGCAEQKKDRI